MTPKGLNASVSACLPYPSHFCIDIGWGWFFSWNYVRDETKVNVFPVNLITLKNVYLIGCAPQAAALYPFVRISELHPSA